MVSAPCGGVHYNCTVLYFCISCGCDDVPVGAGCVAWALQRHRRVSGTACTTFLAQVGLSVRVLCAMVYDNCVACGRCHNPAHRCPIIRLDPAYWISGYADVVRRPVPVHQLTEFDVECPHCCARSWRGESINCCSGGRLQLFEDQQVPDELAEVILSAHVRAHIRRLSVWAAVYCLL